MPLVADRFLAQEGGLARDLATGASVRLIVSAAGGPSDQLRWTLRCEWFAQLRHPAIAPLIDYGSTGETQRFEAWECEPAVAAAVSSVDAVRRRAKLFIEACGRSAGGADAWEARHHQERTVLVPAAHVGFPAETLHAADSLPLDASGISIVSRASLRAVAEAIAHSNAAGPRVLRLHGAYGSGLSTSARLLARVARAHGFIPLSIREASGLQKSEAFRHRSLFLIALDEMSGEDWRRTLLQWTLRAGRPHMVLTLGRTGHGRADCMLLEAIPPAVLVDAVLPAPGEGEPRARLERAAHRAGGSPGRFTAWLWGHGSCYREQVARRSHKPRVSRSQAAERHAEYVVARRSVVVPWPAADAASAERQLAAAINLLKKGAYAAGVRQARAAIAALVRRSAWDAAAGGLVGLARAQVKRGQPDAARATLHEAQVVAGRAGRDVLLLDIALVTARAAIDLARLDEAERSLSAAAIAADAWNDVERMAEAAIGIARCRCWRGQYDEARQCLSRLDATGLQASTRARLWAGEARAALGAGDIAVAIDLALRATEAAKSEPRVLGHCHRALALAYLAIGDYAAVDRETNTALRACRADHDPVGALKTRLVVAERLRRSGTSRGAGSYVSRCSRIGPRLPPLLRLRLALAAALVRAGGDAEPEISRHVDRSGLLGLRFYVSTALPRLRSVSDLTDDVLDILRSCQTAADEHTILGGVCSRLRNRLHATAIAVVVSEDRNIVVLAADGHIDDRIARRVFDAGQMIAPHRGDDGIEGGVPIVYGGDILGALVGRWTIGSLPDPGRTTAVLTMAGAAVGPIVAAAHARRAAARSRDPDELLGTSESMQQVRRAVERASRAPFHVLIEGESGSGKELVARALHRRSPRRDRPFCALNCAALPDDLVEAELFGHARGAFTGAAIERPGVFEEAHTGTLFLDEVGELSLRAQAKLLRVLQEGESRRIGENISRRVDVRVIAATNRNLRDEVAAGRFRLDLFYRLDVIRITLPPLRERREDIPILAEHYWREAAGRVGSRATLTTATLGALAGHDWPGNVRELQNVLASLAVRCAKRGPIPPDALPPAFTSRIATTPVGGLAEARRRFEEQFVRSALARTGGHRTLAARELGLSRQGLSKLMERLNIAAPASPDS